jgi:hypothetical protein
MLWYADDQYVQFETLQDLLLSFQLVVLLLDNLETVCARICNLIRLPITSTSAFIEVRPVLPWPRPLL